MSDNTPTPTTLLLIDVQKDFHPGGSLAIPTANDDAARIATLIRANTTTITRIVATMDSHAKLHIANPCFWWNKDGTQHPDPFTIISAKDIEQGVWKPRQDLKLPLDDSGVLDATIFSGADKLVSSGGDLDLTKYCLEYARRLEQKGRFQICIWPEHCLIGSPGHAIVDDIQQALHEWMERTGGSVEWVLKGQNLLTEMYSALEADVPVSSATSFNQKLFESLVKSDRLWVCGQAMSHCVNYTLRDIVNKCTSHEETNKIYLLTDCASAVPGFEEAAETFQNEMKEAGVNLTVSTDV